MLFTPAKLFTFVFVVLFGGGLLQAYAQPQPAPHNVPIQQKKSILISNKPPLPIFGDGSGGDLMTIPTQVEKSELNEKLYWNSFATVYYVSQINSIRYLWKMNSDGSQKTFLTIGQDPDVCPLDGRVIYNTPNPNNNDKNDIHLMSSDGTYITNLTPENNSLGSYNSVNADWSPDCTRIIYTDVQEPLERGIYIMNASGSNKQIFLPRDGTSDDWYPKWSPDGNWIAFTSNRSNPNGSIYRMKADGTSLQHLALGWYPVWSQDSSRIAYTNNIQIYIMNSDGSNNTQLTNEPTPPSWPVWFSNNQLLYVADNEQNIFMINEDGTGRVNITNDGNSNYRSPTIGLSTPFTLILGVVSFDNDLSGWSKDVLESFRVGTAINPDVQVVLLVDRLGKYNTEIVAISNGVITTSQVIPWLRPTNTFELDTASPQTIAAFLEWGRENYPAGRTMVTFIGHGTGPSPALTIPSRAMLPPLPRPYWLRPQDVTNKRYMSTTELGETLNLATNNGAEPFDIVFLDQCFGGSIEGLYEIRESAELFIASPNYAWGAFPYDAYLASFVTATTNEDIANAVITQYQTALDDTHPNSIFWTRRTEIETIAAQASALAEALQGEIAQNSDLILQASLASQFADTTLTSQDFTLAPPDELIGLGSFTTNLQASFPLTSPVGLAAGDLLTSLQIVQSQTLSQTGSPWSNPNTTWAYTDNFTILAPLTRTLTTNEIWRASIYTDTENLSAQWIVNPDNPIPVMITTPLSFTVDHSWDEFISEWYTTEFTPSVGLFFPTFPQTLVYTNTQILTVTLEAGVNQISLHWDVPPGLDPADFAIRYQQPDVNEWKLITISPGNKHNYKHWVDFAGSHRFQVIARNNERKAIAFSSPVEIITEVEQNIQLNSESSFNTVRLEWNAPNNPRVFRYQIKRSSLTNPNYALIESNHRENIYFDDSVLENGNLYCYRVEAFSQTNILLETSNTSCSRWQQVELEIANVRAPAGSSTIVPIRIRNAAGLRTAGSEFWLSYDPQILQVTDVWPTALTESYTTTYQIQSNGVLSQVIISMTPAVTPAVPLFDQGALFWLEVELLNVAEGDAPLFWRPFVNTVGGTQLWALDPTDNPVNVPLELTLGSITIANNYMLGDVDGSGVIDILDVKKTLGIAIGRETPPEPDIEELQLLAGDLNSNGRIDAADASLILHFIDQGQWPRPGQTFHSLQLTNPQTMTVQLDNPTGAQGQLVTVLLSATNLTDFAGGRVVLTYDPGVIDEVVAIEPLGVAQDFVMEAYNGENGVVVAMASQTPVSGDGVVFQLTVRLRNTAPTGDNPLQIGSVQLNDPYGRDLVQSALQHQILRTDGSIHIYSKIFLPTLLR